MEQNEEGWLHTVKGTRSVPGRDGESFLPSGHPGTAVWGKWQFGSLAQKRYWIQIEEIRDAEGVCWVTVTYGGLVARERGQPRLEAWGKQISETGRDIRGRKELEAN